MKKQHRVTQLKFLAGNNIDCNILFKQHGKKRERKSNLVYQILHHHEQDLNKIIQRTQKLNRT